MKIVEYHNHNEAEGIRIIEIVINRQFNFRQGKISDKTQ